MVKMVEVFVPSGYCSRTFWPSEKPPYGEKINEEFNCNQPFSVYHVDQPHYIRMKNGHLGASPSCRASAAKSMHLLRSVLQPAINQDILETLQKYISVFREAAENACENMAREPFKSSATSVLDPDAMVLDICRETLDNAKLLFGLKDGKDQNKHHKDGLKNVKKTTETRAFSPSMPSNIPSHLVGKRRAASPDFPWNKRLKESRDMLQRRSLSPLPKKPHKTVATLVSSPRRYGSPHRNTKEIVKRKIENQWDPARLTVGTEFVMGTKANRALGLGATRGRIYMKHPDLFKYAGDHEDKKWMVKHNCMAATGGKNTFIMMAEDVMHLFETEYKDSPGTMAEELQFFKLPEFVLQKMRKAMVNEKVLRIGPPSKPSEIQVTTRENSPSTEHKHYKPAVNRQVRQAAQVAAAAINATSDSVEENAATMLPIVPLHRLPDSHAASDSDSSDSGSDSDPSTARGRLYMD
ncbi:unnamed protein product [Clavelina lepadiformis]|uniref:Deoxynucleotidyltransferase terminal-interacting protein 1 n=1 Tax=Clavelina lepadiformis TaxID=159417 RepID=A0ABP0FG51_CLALP